MTVQPDKKHILLNQTDSFAWSANAYLMFAPLLITAAALIIFFFFPHLVMAGPCPFKLVTGFPCATCGASRSTLSLLHFNFLDSFLYNPLLFAGGFLLAGGGIISGFLTWQKQYYQVQISGFTRNWIRAVVIILFLLNWMYEWLIFPTI